MMSTNDVYSIDLSQLTTTTLSNSNLVNSSSTITIADSSLSQSNTIFVSGPGADVVIDGVSVVDTLADIQSSLGGIKDRLAMLEPNPKLEAEWHELKKLGEQYRALEKQLIEKQKIWETLKR